MSLHLPAGSIGPNDPAYDYWNNRSVNLQFISKPGLIIPVRTDAELLDTIQWAVNQQSYFVIRGGGHCLEDFVGNPEVQVIIDISQLKGIRYDPERKAIEVRAGNTLGEVQSFLADQWNVLLPAGEHPDIGIGGHIQGGAFGFLCREHGLGADYLYAVEVIHIDRNGKTVTSTATRDADDPNRELWWAFTGGGAGNFGTVTRFWFRDPACTVDDPARMLPQIPEFIETIELEWLWPSLNEDNFRQLLSVFGNWCRDHSVAGTTGASVFATLHIFSEAVGKIQLKGLLTDPKGEPALDLLLALFDAIPVTFTRSRNKLPWLRFTLNPFPDIFTDARAAFRGKDAFLEQPWSETQLGTIYEQMTRKGLPGGFIGMASYGGKVNTVEPAATASVQRKAIMTTACAVGWMDPADRDESYRWVRGCYAELYKMTGGAPVPNGRTGGCIIAHPDRELADPDLNRSGVPWYEFYYQSNYKRLQAVKAEWDPLDIYHHSLSVQLPGSIDQ
ncbi:MAG: FAD-binding oxidoreductase [Chitinophagaceae bacterium]|nr:MAG: FAD-binding oxidoreductase [Chitinophagaceae bacterium]